MRQIRMSSLGTDTFRICVDAYNNGEVKGRLVGGSFLSPVEFTSLSRLLILLDTALDNETEDSIDLDALDGQGAAATLELEILFRQNYSWQGRVRWRENAQEATFRSVLELIIILETIFSQ